MIAPRVAPNWGTGDGLPVPRAAVHSTLRTAAPAQNAGIRRCASTGSYAGGKSHVQLAGSETETKIRSAHDVEGDRRRQLADLSRNGPVAMKGLDRRLPGEDSLAQTGQPGQPAVRYGHSVHIDATALQPGRQVTFARPNKSELREPRGCRPERKRRVSRIRIRAPSCGGHGSHGASNRMFTRLLMREALMLVIRELRKVLDVADLLLTIEPLCACPDAIAGTFVRNHPGSTAVSFRPVVQGSQDRRGTPSGRRGPPQVSRPPVSRSPAY